jgi:radical SAM superfamily enzyme YgiQ (UPF0313 family)
LRIIIINPSQRAVYGRGILPPYPPLGSLYVAAALLEAGHDVRFFDCDIERRRGVSLSAVLGEHRPQLAGISAATPTFRSAVEIAGTVKRLNPCPVVIGGPHASLVPESVLRFEEFDIAVIGEGERTMVELAEVAAGGCGSLDEVAGICFRAGDRVQRTQPRPLEPDIDRLPLPARHLLPDPDLYSPPDAIARPLMTLIASRGCTNRCTFCSTPGLFGRSVRRRSVPSVMAEIEDCVERYGIREIHLADDCFTSDREWVLDFTRELASLGLKVNIFFMNGLRADQVDAEMLEALKGVGLVNVGFGVESGSQSVLNRTRKGLSLSSVRDGFALAKNLGLTTWAFFMIGLPGEDEGTVSETIRLAKTLDPDFAKFFIFKPYPGSEAHSMLESQGLITDDRLDHYGLYGPPVHRLPGMTESRLAHWFRRANIEFYLRPGKILRHLLRLRSPDQIRLNLRALRFLVQAVGRM